MALLKKTRGEIEGDGICGVCGEPQIQHVATRVVQLRMLIEQPFVSVDANAKIGNACGLHQQRDLERV